MGFTFWWEGKAISTLKEMEGYRTMTNARKKMKQNNTCHQE